MLALSNALSRKYARVVDPFITVGATEDLLFGSHAKLRKELELFYQEDKAFARVRIFETNSREV